MQASREFLQNVLQQLAILQRPQMDDAGKDTATVPPGDWNDLTVLVNDRINLLLTYLQTADEKVQCCAELVGLSSRLAYFGR